VASADAFSVGDQGSDVAEIQGALASLGYDVSSDGDFGPGTVAAVKDFQAMREIVTAKRRKEVLHDWVVKKVKETYVRINPRYRSCNFQYEGWLK